MNTIKRLSAKSHFKRGNVIVFFVMMMLGSLSALATDDTSFIHIKFENEETLDSLRTARPDLSFERIVPYSQKYDDRHRKSGLHLWYKVGVKDSLNAEKLIDELKQNRGIRSVKRPQKIEIPDIESDVRIVTEKNGMQLNSVEKVNDPLYPQQWHYQNAAGVSVNVESAWSIEPGSRNVVVAVMDTRVDVEHPDLHDNAWVNEEEFNGLPDVDDDGNGYVDDIYGLNTIDPAKNIPGNHGTHVAGTIAAVNNNGIGVCGIAGGNGVDTGVRIMTCAILRSSGAGGADETDIAKAYVYAADNGAVISQNSWNGNASTMVDDAINYFMDNAGSYTDSPMTGGLVIFAAGNDNTSDPSSPENDSLINKENLIIVASVGPDGDKASYSNYGDWIDISAPGGEYNQQGVLSTVSNGKYGFMQGTSMACPHVSGIAALVVSKFGGENFTAALAKQKIMNSVNDVNRYLAGKQYDGLMGVGIVDAGKALLDNPNIAPSMVIGIEATKYSESYTELSCIVPADGNGVAVDECVLYVNGDKSVAFDTGSMIPGERLAQSVSDLAVGARIKMQAIDSWGNVAPMSDEFVVKEKESLPYIVNGYEGTELLAYQCNDGYSYQASNLTLSFPVIATAESEIGYAIEDSGRCYANDTFDGETLMFDIVPSSDMAEGTYAIELNVWDKSAPDVVCGVEISYKVRKALNSSIPTPVLKEGKDLTIYTDKLSGEISLLPGDYIEDAMGLEVWFTSNVDIECDEFSHGLHTSIDGDELHITYQYNQDFLDWGNYNIDVPVYAINSYMKEKLFTFSIMYDESGMIDDVNIDKVLKEDEIYTISGVKLNTTIDGLAPGFYIINGNKTVITK